MAFELGGGSPFAPTPPPFATPVNSESSIRCSKCCTFGEGEVWGVGGLGRERFGEVCKMQRYSSLSSKFTLTLASSKNPKPGLDLSCLSIEPPQMVCLASSVKTLSVLPENQTASGGLPGFKSKVLFNWLKVKNLNPRFNPILSFNSKLSVVSCKNRTRNLVLTWRVTKYQTTAGGLPGFKCKDP